MWPQHQSELTVKLQKILKKVAVQLEEAADLVDEGRQTWPKEQVKIGEEVYRTLEPVDELKKKRKKVKDLLGRIALEQQVCESRCVRAAEQAV
jgi:hypothetical protein